MICRFAARQNYSLLWKGYPIIADQAPRPSLFTPLPEYLSFIQRSIICPIRLKAAFLMGRILLNNIINIKGYFPRVFETGVLTAIPLFLKALDGWDGNIASENGILLRKMLKPDIFRVFQLEHAAYSKQKLKVRVELLGMESKLCMDAIAISFGPPSIVPSTIILAETITRFNAMALIRKSQHGKFFRQMFLEYYIVNTVDTSIMSAMDSALSLGCVLAIDVQVSTTLNLVLEDDNSKQVYTNQVKDRPLLLRFETENFRPNLTSSNRAVWKIADVDCYLLSKIRKQIHSEPEPLSS